MSFDKPDKYRLLGVLGREKVDRVPIFEHAIDDAYIEYAVNVKNTNSLNMNPKDHLLLMRHIGMDIATIGYRWIVNERLDCWAKLDTLTEPDMASFLEKVDSYVNVFKGTEVGVNVYVHGPLDQTYLNMGYEQFFYMIHDDIDLVEAIMEKMNNYTLKLLKEILKRDIDMIYLPDDVAFGQGLMIAPELFKKLWISKMEKLIEPVYKKGLPYVFHSDGKSDDFLPVVIDLGFKGITALEPQCNDILEIKKKYGQSITLFGNMDVAGSLAFGTKEDTIKDIKKLLEFLMPGGGYVAMSGNSITNGIKPENYQAMIDTVKQCGRY